MEYDCGQKCRSKRHGEELVTAVTKATVAQAKLFLKRCHNAGTIKDAQARTVLHMAASRGLTELITWLAEEYQADLSPADLESGYTALHRALFYGQIAAARLLINHGASLFVRDHEGLSPLDLTMKERPPHASLQEGASEVYSWGDNSNSTLGHENMQRRRMPELIDIFRKLSISVKQVQMNKYHTVFLSQAGQVYTCGHGRGGRLGHGDELTHLVPSMVESMKGEVCVQIAAAKDHTVMLMESGAVLSCGLNEYHQLGQFPPPASSLVPRQVNSKALKGHTIVGICAQHYHTVLHTKTEIFTCGLNEGQLGHKRVNDELFVSHPRVVSSLIHKDTAIQNIATSRAATAVVTTKGDIYTLYEYQCRKIVSKWLGCVQVAICGGLLGMNRTAGSAHEKSETELTVVMLNTTGKVYIWRTSRPYLSRCDWDLGRPLYVKHLALSLTSVAIVTSEGQAFSANLPRSTDPSMKTAPISSVKDSPVCVMSDSLSQTLADLVDSVEVMFLRLERVPHVHRATAVAMDNRGFNIAALQTQPCAWLTEVPSVGGSEIGSDLLGLMEEANEWDLTHDVLLQIGAHKVAAHRYILAFRSEYFRNIFTAKMNPAADDDIATVVIDDVDYNLFLQMLTFIYTDNCDTVMVGSQLEKVPVSNGESCQTIPSSISVDSSKNISAFAYHSKNKKDKGKKVEENREKASNNPVKALQQMAKRFGVKTLVKRLEAVRLVKGCIQNVQGKHLAKPKVRFERTKYPILHDVVIEGEGGVTLPCHKCILVARLEYFKSMLGSGWRETSSSSSLRLPIPADILKVVIDFLYTDAGPCPEACENVEFVCNVLVTADQLLITRLKEMCEVTIAARLDLRNGCELLEFASMYNAPQLKASCQQFLLLHLGALLEAHALDVLSDDVIQEFTDYYRSSVPSMCRRLITPHNAWPDRDYLEQLESTASESPETETAAKRLTKGRRRRSRTKSAGDDIADGERSRRLSESRLSIGSDDAIAEEVAGVLEEIQEHTQQSTKQKVEPEKGAKGSTLTPRQPNVVIHASHSSSSMPGQTSPSSPPAASALGLRDIMAMEEQSFATAHKHTPSLKKAGRVSQKERKRQQQAAREAEQRAMEGDTATGQPNSPQGGKAENPWGSVNKVVKSFRDLMLDEQKQTPVAMSTAPLKSMATSPRNPKPSPLGKGDSVTISWGLAQINQQPANPRSPSSEFPPLASSPPPENPWAKPASAACRAIQFTDIVSDEMQQSDTLQKATNKPLALIQIEEQAIQELLAHYRGAKGAGAVGHSDPQYDEHITVERVPKQLAKPTWAAINAPRR